MLDMWLAVVHAVACWLHFLTTPPFMLVTCIPPLRSPKGWLVAANTNRPSRAPRRRALPRAAMRSALTRRLYLPDIILNLSQKMRYLVAMADVYSAPQPQCPPFHRGFSIVAGLRPGRPHRRVYQIVCLISIGKVRPGW